MATLQIRVDDEIKRKVDTLLTGLGLDTPTAVRIFLAAVIDNDGIPFIIQKRRMPKEVLDAIRDVDTMTNLSKSYKTAKEAVEAMLEGE